MFFFYEKTLEIVLKSSSSNNWTLVYTPSPNISFMYNYEEHFMLSRDFPQKIPFFNN